MDIHEHETQHSEVAGVTHASRHDRTIAASVLVGAILVSASILYSGSFGVGQRAQLVGGNVPSPSPDAPTQQGSAPALSARDVILGEANAPVSIIEYGDYQCPFCGKFFTDIEPSLRDQYIKSGKVKMAFRNFQFLGPESIAAGEAAECAKDQNKYWAYHDALYAAEVKDGQEHNGNLNATLFLKLAADLGLNQQTFAQCIDSKKYESQIQSDTASAQSAGVNSTPTVFVNDRKILGALPYGQFKTIIEEALKGAK